MIQDKVKTLIEYDKVLKNISAFCLSDVCKSRIVNLTPFTDLAQCENALNQTLEAYKILFEKACDPLYSYDDLYNILEKADINAFLTPYELLAVARTLRACRLAQGKISEMGKDSFPILNEIASKIEPIKSLEEEINNAIINESEISDNASAKLASIRKNISSIRTKIRDKLASYITSPTYSKHLQEAIITIRNDRFVLPVKSDSRGSINGLLHDQSASGSTLYIEPIQIVELNNQLKSYLLEEKAEIERILAELTQKVKNNIAAITINFEIMLQLDIIFSKAKYADSIKAIKPKINNKRKINIIKGRHPLIDKNKVVPIDIEVESSRKVLVISGPNTGGKTVTLKTVGLFCLMAATGILIPCSDQSEIAIFDNIFCDIGDFQSIENSLSTYSSHMKNIIDIIDNITDNSLILIDELGAGTDPTEGAALAIAIIKHLATKDIIAIVTTHYSELKEFSLASSNIRNASMEFDYKTLLPTYRIVMDLPGTSNAIAIASHLGLSKDIINQANSLINQEKHNFERLLRVARQLKSEAEQERELAQKEREIIENERKLLEAENERLRKLREKIQKDAEQEAKQIIAQNVELANDYIQQIEEILKSVQLSESELLKAKQLRTAIEKQEYEISSDDDDYLSKPLSADTIKIGQTAFAVNLNKECVIKSLPDKKGNLDIEVGNISLNINISKLTNAPKNSQIKVKNERTPVSTTKHTPEIRESATSRINILGYNVSDAEAVLDDFLDKALLSGFSEVMIVHGKGTGALRKGVQSYLKTNPLIDSFRLGTIEEGGSGVTVAKLKR